MKKKFFAHFQSESSDDHYIQFQAEQKPRTDADWLPILRECGQFDEETIVGAKRSRGPGICGGWLHVKHVEEIR